MDVEGRGGNGPGQRRSVLAQRIEVEAAEEVAETASDAAPGTGSVLGDFKREPRPHIPNVCSPFKPIKYTCHLFFVSFFFVNDQNKVF